MSSDEEPKLSIPLKDRILLNKPSCSVRNKDCSPKQFRSSRKKSHPRTFQRKLFHECHAKEGLSDQWSMPQTPSPYCAGSKKRQNGDKNEQIAKSKRTCLSDRLLHSEWMTSRKKNGIVEHLGSAHSDGGYKEDECSYSAACSSRKTRDDGFRSFAFNDHDSSPSEVVDPHCENSIHLSSTDGPSSSLGSSSSTADSGALTFCDVRKQPAFTDVLSQPSTSKFGQHCPELENNNSSGTFPTRLMKYPESDEESRSSVNSTSLKGGCQPIDGIRPARKVIGRGCRKILESDDSSDEDWHNHYRRPVKYLSTDSDDSSDFPVKPRKKQFTKYSLSRLSSSDSNDECVSQSVTSLPHHSRSSPAKKTSSSTHNRGTAHNFENDFLGEHSYASPDMTGNNAISTVCCNARGHSSRGPSNSPLITHSRYTRHKGSSRRSISPHPRMLGNRRHSGVSSLASGEFASRDKRPYSHLAVEFPDLFDAEDSSEVEFFTANSYSDTETSESVNGMDARRYPSGCPPHHNSSTVVLSASSEDEISVIYAGSSPDTGGACSRRGRSRGPTPRRRRSLHSTGRGLLSGAQERQSASPDPVEQVRQVEEDERLARMLQAEFDAEANEVPLFYNATESDTDSAVMDPFPSALVTVPFPPLPDSDSYSSGHNAGDQVDRSAAVADHPFTARSIRRRVSPIPDRRLRRPWIRINTTRRGRAPRSYQVQHSGDPWMWQFARVLGLGPTYAPEHDESEYEALLHLAETVGEVIPRGLRKTEINRLPTRKYYSPGTVASSSQGGDEVVHRRTELNKECQVCLCDYEDGDLLRILPCFHEFHTPCIDPWLKINHTCPVCRVEVTFDD